MSDRNTHPDLPDLPCCPFCNGAAELGWDTDGSLYLEVWHDQTCPTEGSPDGHSWCRWYYAEDWDGDEGKMVSDVAAWWSRRDGISPEGPTVQRDDDELPSLGECASTIIEYMRDNPDEPVPLGDIGQLADYVGTHIAPWHHAKDMCMADDPGIDAKGV